MYHKKTQKAKSKDVSDIKDLTAALSVFLGKLFESIEPGFLGFDLKYHKMQ